MIVWDNHTPAKNKTKQKPKKYSPIITFLYERERERTFNYAKSTEDGGGIKHTSTNWQSIKRQTLVLNIMTIHLIVSNTDKGNPKQTSTVGSYQQEWDNKMGSIDSMGIKQNCDPLPRNQS